MAGRKVLDMARELVEISAVGLARAHADGFANHDETIFLDPLREQVEKEKSPGQEVAESWRGEWGMNRERLIKATRY